MTVVQPFHSLNCLRGISNIQHAFHKFSTIQWKIDQIFINKLWRTILLHLKSHSNLLFCAIRKCTVYNICSSLSDSLLLAYFALASLFSFIDFIKRAAHTKFYVSALFIVFQFGRKKKSDHKKKTSCSKTRICSLGASRTCKKASLVIV